METNDRKEGSREEQSITKRATSFTRNSVNFKIFIITMLVIILLIPTSMVSSLIKEREMRQRSVVHEISSKWGNAQTITGPVLTIPFKQYFTDDKGKRRYLTEYAHFLPEDLHISGILNPELRYRGIFKTVVYNSPLEISGKFSFPLFEKLNINEKNVLWSRASLSIGISDLRGIKEPIDAGVKGSDIIMDPGLETMDVFNSGISSRVVMPQKGEEMTFNFKINLNGSRKIEFVPVGKITQATIKSKWKSPSFDGAFLPADRKIDEEGFSATWKVLHLNRNFPQQWRGDKYKVCNTSFGVKLFIAADVYQKSERMMKYAVMFIVLTFTAFFFSEVMNKKRIHPIQYLLIGFAITIFYILLVSISEHINFDRAYFIASVAVIGLITSYSLGILKSRVLASTVFGVLAALYTYLYILLQLEDYALVMGSIGLFIVLSAVMYMTRKISWYSIALEEDENGGSEKVLKQS
ncbi:MAG: cell envelope integrity protein CreD [Deltaproteobacteria bacterium]|nr:cell envelope integrity protein CreD [Deltaproteobacteria bacterium]